MLEYVERTTAPGIVATSEATAEVVMTLPALVLDGTQDIYIEHSHPWWGMSTTTAVAFLTIFGAKDGAAAAPLQRTWDSRAWATSAQIGGFTTRTPLLTPAAGSWVYTLRAHSSASNTFTLQAGGGGAGVDMPMSMMAVEVLP